VRDFQKLAGRHKEIQLLPHHSYSPDFAPVDFFLFRKKKEQLAGLHLTQESLKSA
jgi:hypothetical protein